MNAYFRWLCASVLMAVICSAEAFTPPALNGKRVNDYAHILQSAEVGAIEQTLAQYEAKTANQIAVLTVSSLQGETIESFANATFKSWRLGQKGKDNGILLLISVGEKNTARIEVGYGLEGSLPDITCGSIIRNDIRPEFKQKHYAAAILAGIAAIEKAISGQYKVVAATVSSSSGGLTTAQLSAISIGVIGLIITIILCCVQRILGGVGGAISAFIAINILLSSIGWAITAAILGFFIGMIARDLLEDGVCVFLGGGDGGDSSSNNFSGGGGSSGGGGASGSLD